MELGFILPSDIRSFKDLERFIVATVLAKVAELVEAAVRRIDESLSPPGRGWESVRPSG